MFLISIELLYIFNCPLQKAVGDGAGDGDTVAAALDECHKGVGVLIVCEEADVDSLIEILSGVLA